MKTLPLMFGTGLLCAGIAVGCAESNTPAPGASGDTPSDPAIGDSADTVQAAWVQDTGVTKAHLQVQGMT